MSDLEEKYKYNAEIAVLKLVFVVVKKYKNRELIAEKLGITSRTLSNRAHDYGFENFKLMRKFILRQDNSDMMVGLYIRNLEREEKES